MPRLRAVQRMLAVAIACAVAVVLVPSTVSTAVDQDVDKCKIIKGKKPVASHGLHFDKEGMGFLPTQGRLRGYVVFYVGRDDTRMVDPYTGQDVFGNYDYASISQDAFDFFVDPVMDSMRDMQEAYRNMSRGKLELEIQYWPQVLKVNARSEAIGAFAGAEPWAREANYVGNAATSTGFNPLDADFIVMVGVRQTAGRGGGASHRSAANARFGRNNPNMPILVLEHYPEVWQNRLNYVASHEMGHLLGFPDLYGESPNTPEWRFVSRSLLMEAGTPEQGLSGYARWIAGWIDDDDVICLDLEEDLPEGAVYQAALSNLVSPANKGGTKELLVVKYPGDATVGVVEARPRPKLLDTTIGSPEGDLTSFSYDVNGMVESGHKAGRSPSRRSTKAYAAPILTARLSCDGPLMTDTPEKNLVNSRINGFVAEETEGYVYSEADNGSDGRWGSIPGWYRELLTRAFAHEGYRDSGHYTTALKDPLQAQMLNGEPDPRVSPLSWVLVTNTNRGTTDPEVLDTTTVTVQRKLPGCVNAYRAADEGLLSGSGRAIERLGVQMIKRDFSMRLLDTPTPVD